MGHPSCLLCVFGCIPTLNHTHDNTEHPPIGSVVMVRAIVALKWSGVRLGLSAQRKKVPFPLTVFNLTSKQVFSFVT